MCITLLYNHSTSGTFYTYVYETLLTDVNYKRKKISYNDLLEVTATSNAQQCYICCLNSNHKLRSYRMLISGSSSSSGSKSLEILNFFPSLGPVLPLFGFPLELHTKNTKIHIFENFGYLRLLPSFKYQGFLALTFVFHL